MYEVSTETPQDEPYGWVFLGFIKAVDHISALEKAKQIYGGHPAVAPCDFPKSMVN